MTEQSENLKRVRERIESEVLSFVGSLRIGSQFRMEDLTSHVRDRIPGCAPDSPGRIMRFLRRRGDFNYRVVKRSESLYERTPVETAPEQLSLL